MEYLSFLEPETARILLQLVVAMLLGALLGTERIVAHKTAGMRTYGLISMGAALFVIVSMLVIAHNPTLMQGNPLQIASQIVVGIGFIGGGLIFVHGNTVKGLTTASGLWVAAGIGMAVGFELYTLAILATAMTLFIFTILWYVEDKIKMMAGCEKEE